MRQGECAHAAQMICFVSLRFFFQYVDGLSPIQIGVLITPWPAALVVINKSDLADWYGDGIRTVASRGIGVDDLRSQIRRRFGVLDMDEHQPRCWTSRQREQIAEALRAKSALPG